MKVVITLKYKVLGPDKKDLILNTKYLKEKNNYQYILDPYDFELRNLKIEITKQKLILTIKNIKIDDQEDFINNFNNNFTDSWGEGIFDFGKDYYYYADNGKALEKKDIKKLKKYKKSYYILNSVSLPINSQYATKNCQTIISRRPQYFYKDLSVNKYKNDDKYYITDHRTPMILKKNYEIDSNELPKKYYKDVIKTDEYLVCYAPKKYQNKIILEKNENINEIFYRDGYLKGLQLNGKIIYQGKLNTIFFKEASIKIIK